MIGAVGVLGGSGTVGRIVVDRLAAADVGTLRIGGRDLDKIRAIGAEAAEAVQVDLFDDASLAAFCAGCAVVINCAGPSYQVLARVARVAVDAGAGYVDAAGDLVALEALTSSAPAGLNERPAVFSAGLMPGLTGLLPRLLATEGPIGRLEIYVGGAVPIGALSAVDALLTRGPKFGSALAAWRGGQVIERALAPLRSVTLPGFRGKVHAWPFLSTETAALAAHLGVEELRSYTVYGTENLPVVLATAWADPTSPVDAHIAAVVAAADRDVAECGRYYTLLAHARPRQDSGGRSRRLMLRTPDSYQLSGVVAAITAGEILGGRVPPGAHFAADVLDPRRMVDLLADDELVTALELPTSDFHSKGDPGCTT